MWGKSCGGSTPVGGNILCQARVNGFSASRADRSGAASTDAPKPFSNGCEKPRVPELGDDVVHRVAFRRHNERHGTQFTEDDFIHYEPPYSETLETRT